MTTPTSYDVIALIDARTVVAEFVPDPSKDPGYQSETQLEAAFIKLLRSQAYGYLPIANAAASETSLRTQLDAPNKTARIQEDHIQVLKRDDSTVKNIYLIDKANVHNNRLKVINQYEVDGGSADRTRSNRYQLIRREGAVALACHLCDRRRRRRRRTAR